MEFNAWLVSKGWDPEAITAAQKVTLQAAWRLEHGPKPDPAPEPKPKPSNQSTTFDETMKAIEAENKRVEYIRDRTVAACNANVGNTAKLKQLREMCDAAIADPKTDARGFDLAMLRVDRDHGMLVINSQQPPMNEAVLEAAICQTHRVPGVEKQFSDQVLQAAHSRFRSGLSLKDLLAVAAERNNGYRSTTRDIPALCKAAFGRASNTHYDFRSESVGASTINVPGILSNAANKTLAANWLYTEQAWRRIAKIRNANDFKQMTTYRLNGSAKFERIAPGGEIKHGSLSETGYTNQVANYGKLLGVTYEDMVNDDLGAFMSLAAELSRGAGDAFNEVFWTELLDDAAFFPTDKSLGNYDDGDPDSVLSLAGLENADAIFAAQTKPDGTPLGAIPKILLVPRGLRSRASTLMKATGLTGQGANAAPVPDDNPWAGLYEVVDSIYLSSSAIARSSATAWYLLADPMNIAIIEAAFLNGQETPTVETGEFDFNRLGLAMRAYMAFGCRKQEYRGGVKLKGAA